MIRFISVLCLDREAGLTTSARDYSIKTSEDGFDAIVGGRCSAEQALCLMGVGFAEVLATKGIVAERATTNDVAAVMATLGIEAATRVLFDEITATLANDYICQWHIMLLCSTMTHLGHLMPMSRHGLNRVSDNGPMARCSFEECVEQIFDAAMYGEVDPVNDVTSRIMVGRRAVLGTGVCCVKSLEDAASSDDDDVVYTGGPDSDEEPTRAAVAPSTPSHGEPGQPPREALWEPSCEPSHEPSCEPSCEPATKRRRSYSPSSPGKDAARFSRSGSDRV